jgi:hypothetical protein
VADLPGGVQLWMGDDSAPASTSTRLRLIAKTNKKAYLVDSLGNETPLEGFPTEFVKAKANTPMVGGQLVVVFAALGMADEPDDEYSISRTPHADENVYIAAKATTGFTLQSSDGSSTSQVDWAILRTA